MKVCAEVIIDNRHTTIYGVNEVRTVLGICTMPDQIVVHPKWTAICTICAATAVPHLRTITALDFRGLLVLINSVAKCLEILNSQFSEASKFCIPDTLDLDYP